MTTLIDSCLPEILRDACVLKENFAHLFPNKVEHTGIISSIENETEKMGFSSFSIDNNSMELHVDTEVELMRGVGDDLARDLGAEWHTERRPVYQRYLWPALTVDLAEHS